MGILPLLIFIMFGAFASLVGKGIKAGERADYNKKVSYKKTANQYHDQSSGEDDRFDLHRDNLTELRRRMNEAKERNTSMQSSTSRTARVREKGQATKSMFDMLGGNNPLKKTSFDNHEESSAYILDEETESKELWALNRMRMQAVNNDFNQFVVEQHLENQRLMKKARSIDR